MLVLILVGRQCSDSMGSFSFSRAICNHLETYEKHWMFSAAACKEHYIAVSETHNLQEKQNQNVLGYLTTGIFLMSRCGLGLVRRASFLAFSSSITAFTTNKNWNWTIYYLLLLYTTTAVVTRGGGRVSSSSSVGKGPFLWKKKRGAKYELHRNRREFNGCNWIFEGKASFRQIAFSHSKTVNSKLYVGIWAKPRWWLCCCCCCCCIEDDDR